MAIMFFNNWWCSNEFIVADISYKEMEPTGLYPNQMAFTFALMGLGMLIVINK